MAKLNYGPNIETYVSAEIFLEQLYDGRINVVLKTNQTTVYASVIRREVLSDFR